MVNIIESTQISGVKIVHFQQFTDNRGYFMEIFRKEWFPERSWQVMQMNTSQSKATVLRGLHYHFQQVDYWYVPHGRILVAMVDIRQSSPTQGKHQLLEIGDSNRVGVFIPCGVAHGFLALTPAIMTYVVDNYYNNSDELGVAWNDPTFAINWGISNPIISERDQQNPLLHQIAADKLPIYCKESIQ